MTTFSLGDTDFLRDDRPHRVISGAIHYFRVHPDHWEDRIRKARLMGLNTIETYVAWNAHEPRRGEWDASGWNDLGRFLDLVHAAGMDAIVRPGPYICAEWHNGGLPVWVTGDGRDLRSSAPDYLADVSAYLRRVYEIVAPRQIDRGGPVVLVQIENEYGAYGSDKAYLKELVAVTRGAGITVPLTTVDQPTDRMLADGSLPELHKTASFGSRSAERLATLRRHQPTGPLMCSEFWDGWFDWWGGVHHTTDVAAAAADLDALLATGASVNIYMFHGGTNFGLTNGANDKGRYLPLVTSYDYDAPLDEAGNPTEKFFAFREVIARYAPVPDELPARSDPAPAFDVALAPQGAWTDAAASGSTTDRPQTFDELAHLSALVRYDVELPEGRGGLLVVADVRDLAWVSVDGAPVGTLARTRHDVAIRIPDGRALSILVEDQGRVNYDRRLGEEKGLVGAVTLDGAPLQGWRSTPLDVAAIADRVAGSAGDDRLGAETAGAGPIAWSGDFGLDAPADLFLDTALGSKGYAFVNGLFLGRYWRNGPQRTLYVPGPATRAGTNRLVVLELEQLIEPRAVFARELSLGDTEE
ncbi:glycoside hydrolase family 35 protein [Microbacterium sp. 179-I 3D2 NHS]|uniref:glycoside hydrolase family 35 protein n=1 Tax=Microbacterium sp. 179-I 3D2 NHS TaxID=3235178 RepID=UPI0039A0E002